MALGAPYLDPAGQFIAYGPIGGNLDIDTAGVALTGTAATFCGHGSDLADVDGDGIADGIVAAYAVGSGAGRLYVELGPLTEDVDLASEADVRVDGTDAGSSTGRVVHAGADVDGDGIGDLGVGSVGNSTGGPYAGGVYVVHGPVTIASFADADLLVGPGPYAYTGNNFALGDFDGDGFGDVAVSVSSTAAGAAHIAYGPIVDDLDLADAAVILEGSDTAQYVGLGLGSSDVDGDGVDEILVGAPGNEAKGVAEGTAFLVSDPPSGTSVVTDVALGIFRGAHPGDAAGMGVAAGDLDGAGALEMLIGGPGMDEGGGLSVVYAEL